MTNKTDSRKVPGMTELLCNGRTYGNTYAITFKVGPLRGSTFAPPILPLSEAAVEGFSWNLPEFGRHIRFDVLHG
jgi:hypothetical protein